jgi:hypothetical protein
MLVIALFNAVIGWTVVGWVIALYWSVQPNPPKDLAKATKDRERRVGMGKFSRMISDRIAARASRGGRDRKDSPR